MSKFKSSALALAVLGAAAAVPAQAYVMAGSMVNMKDFTIKDATGATIDRSAFGSLDFTTSADQSVALTGYAGVNNSASSATGSINFAPICVGAACNPVTADVFPKFFAPPGAGNYVAADQYESGAPVSGLPNFPVVGANVADGSYVALTDGTVDGSGNSNNNLNAKWTFSLNSATALTFDFMVDAYLQAAISDDEIFPGYATASYQMDFTITDLSNGGVTVWTYAPDLFGDTTKTLSLNAPLPMDIESIRNTCVTKTDASDCFKSFSSSTGVLSANTLYQLSARIQTNVDATRVQQVPEPGVLGLLGLGLAALGFTRRRRETA